MAADGEALLNCNIERRVNDKLPSSSVSARDAHREREASKAHA